MEEDGAKRLTKLERFFNNRCLMWGGRRVPLRASFGFAPYSGTCNVEDVLHMADVRLYAHKARARMLGTCS